MLYTFMLLLASFGPNPPPAPTDEIRSLIFQLGDDEYAVRENAEEKLKKLKHKAIRGCLNAAACSDSPEIRFRAKIVVNNFYGVFSNDPKNPYPSIYLLNDKIRFPHGITYSVDSENDGEGWCKEMIAPLDIAAYYFELARENYNNRLSESQKSNGWKITCWRDDYLEQEATRLFVHDLLYNGKNPKEIKEFLNEAAERIKTHKNLYRHYGHPEYNADDEAIPGPAVEKSLIPDSAKNRFYGKYPR